MRAQRGVPRIGSLIAGARPIGIDFDVDHVHCIQLESKTRGAEHLKAACSVPHDGDVSALLSEPALLREFVADQILQRGRFKGTRIVTQAPPEHLRLMVLNYTLAPNKSDVEQIVELTRERVQGDLSDYVVDYLQIRTSGQQQGERSALVAVIPEEPVIDHLEALRKAGLHVERLEIPPVAIRRLIASTAGCPPDSEDLSLVVQIGPEKTELTLLSGRRLLLYREVELGSTALVSAASDGLDCDADTARELLSTFGVGRDDEADYVNRGGSLETVDDADPFGSDVGISGPLREILRPGLRTLVEQSHKAISYAAFQTRGSSINRVDLVSSSLACPGLDSLLAELLQLHVEPMRPLRGIEGAEALSAQGDESRWAIALGFALQGLDYGS